MTPEFATRVQRAQQVLAAQRARGDDDLAAMPVHVRDQANAAIDDAKAQNRQLHDLANALFGRRWHHHHTDDPTDERYAYLMACMLGCSPCAHVQLEARPQVVYALLPLRRALCQPCYLTIVAVGADIARRLGETDRCDVCGKRRVRRFTPFQAQYSNVLIGGDACRDCARVLFARKRPA